MNVPRPRLAIAIVFLLLLGLQPADTAARRALIVRALPGRSAADLGVTELRRLQDGTMLVLPGRGERVAAAVQRLTARTDVIYAAAEQQRHLTQLSADPLIGDQWGLPMVDVAAAWARTRGNGVLVAVIDSGVDVRHVEFAGRILPGYDAVLGIPSQYDRIGHGTAVAGIIAAAADNGSGGTGICPGCRILPIRACDAYGRCDDFAIADGIRYAVDNGAQVINMSLGGPGDAPVLREAVRYAVSRGVLLVAAAGNDGDTTTELNFPAAYPDVIAVGATDRNDSVGYFSTAGDYVALTAPGVEIASTFPSNDYVWASGTSAASPFVAGALALLRAARPDLTADDLSCLLLSGTDDLGPAGYDRQFGYGRLNIGRAMQQIDTYRSCPLTGRVLTEGDPFAQQPPPADGRLWFVETGQTLAGSFRDFWERNGGLAVFGFPISREFRVADAAGRPVTVQYFERHRFEYRPDRDARFDVLLSRIGADRLHAVGRDWFSEPRSGAQNSCRYFAETDQSVCGALLSYWLSNGLEFNGRGGIQADESLVLFGLPLTAAQTELTPDGLLLTVQWFERARLELHGDVVLGGLLGREEAGRP